MELRTTLAVILHETLLGFETRSLPGPWLARQVRLAGQGTLGSIVSALSGLQVTTSFLSPGFLAYVPWPQHIIQYCSEWQEGWEGLCWANAALKTRRPEFAWNPNNGKLWETQSYIRTQINETRPPPPHRLCK